MVVAIHPVVELTTLMPAVHIVVADDIQQVQEFDAGSAAIGRNLVVPGGDRAGGILSVEDIHELFENSWAEGPALFANFIPGTVHDHRRMIEIPADKGYHILFMPLVKVLKVAVRVLAHLPFVKDFVLHQEAQTVTKVQKLRSHRVVRGPDGVASHGFQDP